MSKKYLALPVCLIILLYSLKTVSQSYHGHVEGDLIITGRLNASTGKDSTSIYIGLQSGVPQSLTSLQYNTALGYSTGAREGPPIGSGQGNVLIGFQSGDLIHSGNYNTFIGANVGKNLTSESRNTMVGTGAGEDVSTSGSVFLGYQSGRHISDQDNILYISNRSGSSPLIYGDFENKKVGINYTGSSSDALFIESPHNNYPFRVRIEGSTKLRIHPNGGTSFGANLTPPSEGLRVFGLADTLTGRISCDPNGNLIRSKDLDWIAIPPSEFREWKYNGTNFIMRAEELAFYPDTEVTVFAPVKMDDDVRVKKIKIIFEDHVEDGELFILNYNHQTEALDTILNINENPNSTTENFIQVVEKEVDIPIHSEYDEFDIRIRRIPDPPMQISFPVGFYLKGILVGYEYQ